MVYQLNGKYGPFTIDAKSDRDALAASHCVSSHSSSVYISDPCLIPVHADDVEASVKMLEFFPSGEKLHIDQNLDALLEIFSDFIPGYKTDRDEYLTNVRQLLDEKLPDDEEKSALFMLKNAFQNAHQSEGMLNLYRRVEQVVSMLEYRKKQLDVKTIV